MIRVLVAATRPTVRAGLAAVLRADTEIEVTGEAASASDLLTLAAERQPDAVLIELETSQEELGGALATLIAETSDTGVVVICDADSRWIADALRNGVRGVLARDAESTAIVAAVTAVAQGLIVLPAAAARTLLPSDTTPAPIAGTASMETLTARELEVLRLLGEGLGNKGIAYRLRISEHTVKFHVGALMAKLGASSRTEAVAIAARRGLIML